MYCSLIGTKSSVLLELKRLPRETVFMAMLLIFCDNYKGQELTYTLKTKFGKLNKEKVLFKNSVQTSVESSETNTIFFKES